MEEEIKKLPPIYWMLYEEYVYGKNMLPEEAAKLVLEGFKEFENVETAIVV